MKRERDKRKVGVASVGPPPPGRSRGVDPSAGLSSPKRRKMKGRHRPMEERAGMRPRNSPSAMPAHVRSALVNVVKDLASKRARMQRV